MKRLQNVVVCYVFERGVKGKIPRATDQNLN